MPPDCRLRMPLVMIAVSLSLSPIHILEAKRQVSARFGFGVLYSLQNLLSRLVLSYHSDNRVCFSNNVPPSSSPTFPILTAPMRCGMPVPTATSVTRRCADAKTLCPLSSPKTQLGFRIELVGRKGLISFSRQYRLTSEILALGLLCSL